MGTIGEELERREDAALLTGEAEYLDDLDEPGTLHAAFLRSRYAHARIEVVDTTRAVERESVVAVYTADDIHDAGGISSIPVATSLPRSSTTRIRQEVIVPDRPLLAKDRVRYVGQPIAMIVAHDRYQAHDAAELVEVDCERCEAITHPDEALSADAPTVHDEAEDNVAFDWEGGDREAVDAAFDEAAHTVRVERDHQRLIPNSIEPRGVLANYRRGRLDVAMSSQIPHMQQFMLSHVLDVPESRIRVWTPDVGGGFGIKSKYYPDEAVVAWGAMQLGRPVKWQATRTESSASDAHGRAHVSEAEMALDEEGNVLAVRVDDRKGLGAFLQRGAPAVNTSSYATVLSGQYRIPEMYCRVRAVFTNQTPAGAYRGSSRPEGAYVIERLMGAASKELDVDPAALRRRNLIPADGFPYSTPIVGTYDSGNYEPAFDVLLDRLDYETLRERQAERREEGRYLGIGFGCFVEPAGSSPIGGSGGVGAEPAHIESSRIGFQSDGSVIAYAGTAEQGQGHRTTYAQIVADRLGVDYDDVEILEGDTDQANHGVGSHSSRSVIMAGNSLVASAEKVIEKARGIAARQLEVTGEDVAFHDGTFSVKGAPDRSVHIQAVARESYFATGLPEAVEPGLEATTYYDSDGVTFPFGAHAALVEVDPETGDISIERYVAVDDCGVQINPKLVEGQIEGGVVQGIGQALVEGATYDDNGNLLNGSFQDYPMPRAERTPEIETDHTVTPSPLNTLGVKGTGEAGTVGAPVTVLNAVLDALEPLGVDSLDMPMHPEHVWQSIHDDGT